MFVESGIKGLDEAIQGLRLGDNVVWQVEYLPDYVFFAEPFIAKALRDGRRCVYIRFAPHPPVLEHRQGLEVVEIDPGQGFDYFSREVHKAIEERGRGVFYVFDNISSLVVEWATDELLANFFQVTCPYLLELDTIAYFALTRGKHSNSAVARIRDTTQVPIDIGSDVFFTFLVDNDLFRLRLKLTSNSHLSYDEFAEVEQRFLSGRFPPAIMEQFRNMLDYFGQAPIIVRSSSLLEDSFGNAFAGKYRSEFCANQGSPEERMESFLRAVKLVYASAINPDALSYRRKRGLGESDEQMAILVQRVSGMPYKRFFFPCLAGVAFSRNLYAWSGRIDPEQGIIRLVFGLGTRAVERVGKDYPRMIPVSNPELRPESASEVARYSQRQVDLLDLEANEFTSIPLPELLSARDYPGLYLLVSVLSDGYPVDPVGGMVDGSPRDFLLTFNNLIRRTEFCRIMGTMLSRLEAAYGHPVDIEFTAAIRQDESVKVNLLQCRPLFLPGSAGPVFVPEIKSEARVLWWRTRPSICPYTRTARKRSSTNPSSTRRRTP